MTPQDVSQLRDLLYLYADAYLRKAKIMEEPKLAEAFGKIAHETLETEFSRVKDWVRSYGAGCIQQTLGQALNSGDGSYHP